MVVGEVRQTSSTLPFCLLKQKAVRPRANRMEAVAEKERKNKAFNQRGSSVRAASLLRSSSLLPGDGHLICLSTDFISKQNHISGLALHNCLCLIRESSVSASSPCISSPSCYTSPPVTQGEFVLSWACVK